MFHARVVHVSPNTHHLPLPGQAVRFVSGERGRSVARRAGERHSARLHRRRCEWRHIDDIIAWRACLMHRATGLPRQGLRKVLLRAAGGDEAVHPVVHWRAAREVASPSGGVSARQSQRHRVGIRRTDLQDKSMEKIMVWMCCSFMVGDKLTYVDLGVLHVLRATASQFAEQWNALQTVPLLKAFKERMEARPNLAAYFKSDRCRPFEGNSMM